MTASLPLSGSVPDPDPSAPAGVAAPSEPALEWRGVTRRFGAAVAVDSVSLAIQPGTIHALVGENGAGKSTLLKMAAGLVAPSEGEIRIGGRPVRLRSAADGARAGVGTVHQHFMLVEPFTAAENLALGMEPGWGGPIAWLSPMRLQDVLRRLSEVHRLPVEPGAVTGNLGVGMRQRLEILKALRRDSPILALDEPTAVLAPQEVDDLLRTLLDLREGGRTIILVTHKLREVLDVADTISVLRRGCLVATVRREDTDAEKLSRLIIGAPEDGPVPYVVGPHEPAPSDTPPMLAVQGLGMSRRQSGGGRKQVLAGVTLEVAPGEILAVAGIEGNGQSELVGCLAGALRGEEGQMLLGGRDILRLPTVTRRALGLGIIPEDRHRQGLVLEMSVADNLRLGRHRDRSRLPVMELLQQFDVRPPRPTARVASLSGGNQQKLLLAREATLPGLKVLVAAQPTRGVDLGAIALIHQVLLDLRAQGVAILLISSELDEVLALGDRIAVMREGRVVWTGDNNNLDPREVGRHMLATTAADFEALEEQRAQDAARGRRERYEELERRK